MSKINSNVKRVKLSLTYEELHLIDDALFQLANAKRYGISERRHNAQEKAAKRLEEAAWHKLRDGRILPLVNRWYDFRRAETDKAYAETLRYKVLKEKRAS